MQSWVMQLPVSEQGQWLQWEQLSIMTDVFLHQQLEK